MKKEYKTISKRENIQDKDLIKIFDYIERVTSAKTVEYKNNEAIFGDISIVQRKGEDWETEYLEISKFKITEKINENTGDKLREYSDDIMVIKKGILAEAITTLYPLIRNYKF